MWKNQLFYGSILLVLAVLLFFFSNSFLLYALVTLVLMAVIAWILLKLDAQKLEVELQVRSGIRLGNEMPLTLNLKTGRRLLVTGCVFVRMNISYEMSQKTEQRTFLIPSNAKENQFQLDFFPEECGDVRFSCVQIKIYDILNLFARGISSFGDQSTTVYPEKIPLQIEMGQTMTGSFRDNGLVQNRKGDDQSEIFDIRDYVPGDDIRAIHWKLSSKSDHLIMRQASDRYHYNVALLADIGLYQGETPTTKEERNMAAAIYASIAESLTGQGKVFCMLVPSEQGLQICEVAGMRSYEKVVSQWLGICVPGQAGLGVQYFVMEHLEQYFSRVIIVTAGKYNQSLQGLESRISVTVVHAVEGGHYAVTDLNESGRVIEIPCEKDRKEAYHILC